MRVNSGPIEVKGVVETEIRKAELLAGLKGIPWVDVKIQTVEESRFELPSQTEILNDNENMGASSEQDSSLKAKSETLVIQDRLEEYFAAARSEGRSSAGQEEAGATSIHQAIAALSHNAVAVFETARGPGLGLAAIGRINFWAKIRGVANIESTLIGADGKRSPRGFAHGNQPGPYSSEANSLSVA
jgi:hypothetical protein